MKTRCEKRLFQITFWLVTEILLNLLGLDNMADYSEFVFKYKIMTLSNQPESRITMIANFNWLDYDSVFAVQSIP